MKKEDFHDLDRLHVPSDAKKQLLIQTDRQFANRKKERNTGMRMKGLLAAAAALVLVVGLISMNSSGTVDYEGYYNAVAEHVDIPQEQLNQDNLQLHSQLLRREISIEEYLEQKNEITGRQNAINERKADIRTQYKINEDSLDTIKFSNDPDKNSEIINNLKNELELERQEEELDRMEEQAMEDYRTGKITAEQLIQTMVQLDAKDKLLDRKEDLIEGETMDQEDLAEYELADQLLNGQITPQQYLEKMEEIDKMYDDLDDDEDDDDDDDEDEEDDD